MATEANKELVKLIGNSLRRSTASVSSGLPTSIEIGLDALRDAEMQFATRERSDGPPQAGHDEG